MMKLTLPLMLVLAQLCSCQAQTQAAQDSIDGFWDGTAGNSNGSGIAVTFAKSAGGTSGNINIPGSGLLEESLTNISYSKGKLHFELTTDLGIVPFDGMVKDGVISGVFQLGPNPIAFYLKRSTPKPATYRQEVIRFQNGAVALGGTLMRPIQKGPHPAIIFVQGSGAQSRFSPGEKFRADVFLRLGIAVLVYDKRGVGSSTGDWRNASFDDLAGDASAAVEFLKNVKGINPQQIGLHGRSQGAWLVELIAARSNVPAFIITEVGGGVAPWQQETYSVEAQMRSAGFPEGQIKAAISYTKLHYDVARGAKSWEEYMAVVESVKTEKWISFKRPWRSLEQARLTWEKIMGYDPHPALQKLTCPVLALFTERDLSTPTNESIAAMKEAFHKSGHKRHAFKVFPQADHAMLIYSEGSIPLLPSDYIKTMTDWVRATVSRRVSRSRDLN